MSFDKTLLPPLGQLILLVGINAAMFAGALMASVFGVDIIKSLVLEAGEAPEWRPLTYMFVHTGLFHFLWNMAVLTLYGTLACSLGLYNFLFPLYIAGGLAGAGAFYLIAPDGAMLAGSSAAVLCVITAEAYWAYDLRIGLLRNLRPTLRTLTIVIGTIAVVLPLLSGEYGATSAHIAGIAAGILIAAVFSMPARAILTRTRRSRSEMIERRRRAVLKASRSGYSALTKAEKDSL